MGSADWGGWTKNCWGMDPGGSVLETQALEARKQNAEDRGGSGIQFVMIESRKRFLSLITLTL